MSLVSPASPIMAEFDRLFATGDASAASESGNGRLGAPSDSVHFGDRAGNAETETYGPPSYEHDSRFDDPLVGDGNESREEADGPEYGPENRPAGYQEAMPSRTDASGAGYDSGPAMESGLTREVAEVIASKNLKQITSELGTRNRMLDAAKEELAKCQRASTRDPENAEINARISEAQQDIEQEHANITALEKAEKGNTPFYKKAFNGMQSPLGQMGMMMGLPMAMSGIGSLFGGGSSTSSAGGQPQDSSTDPTNSDGSSSQAQLQDAINNPANAQADAESAAASLDAQGPLTSGEESYLLSGMGQAPTGALPSPGVYSSGFSGNSNLSLPV